MAFRARRSHSPRKRAGRAPFFAHATRSGSAPARADGTAVRLMVVVEGADEIHAKVGQRVRVHAYVSDFDGLALGQPIFL